MIYAHVDVGANIFLGKQLGSQAVRRLSGLFRAPLFLDLLFPVLGNTKSLRTDLSSW